MRWFVVADSAPLAKGPSSMAQAHPPRPGLPRQDPSVKTTRLVSSTTNNVSGSAAAEGFLCLGTINCVPSCHAHLYEPTIAQLRSTRYNQPIASYWYSLITASY